VLTRNDALDHLHAIVVAPITRTVRGIATEVELGPEDGLPSRCAMSLDNLATIEKDVFLQVLTSLSAQKMNEVYEGLHAAFALPY